MNEEKDPDGGKNGRQAQRGAQAQSPRQTGALDGGELQRVLWRQMLAQKAAEVFLGDYATQHAGIDQQTGGQGDQRDDVKDDALMFAKEGTGGLGRGVEGDGIGGEEEGL